MAEGTCENQAAFRFTWPGDDESFICRAHSDWMRQVAKTMGLHLQLIPLSDEADEMCRQKTGGD